MNNRPDNETPAQRDARLAEEIAKDFARVRGEGKEDERERDEIVKHYRSQYGNLLDRDLQSLVELAKERAKQLQTEEEQTAQKPQATPVTSADSQPKPEPAGPTNAPEARETAPETPSKIPSMSMEQFLLSNANETEKQRRIEQLASGKAYRFENGKRVTLTVKIEKDGEGNYKDTVTVTKTTEGGQREEKSVKLSALKLQIWEPHENIKGPSPLQQNDNVTYRHQDGTVTDKMKFLGRDEKTGAYWFQKEPTGRPFTVKPDNVRICRERNENGTMKENGTFAITRQVPKEQPAAPTTQPKQSAATEAPAQTTAAQAEAPAPQPEAAVTSPVNTPMGVNKEKETPEETKSYENLAQNAIAKMTPEEFAALRKYLGLPEQDSPAAQETPAAAPVTAPKELGWVRKSLGKVWGWIKKLWPKKKERVEEEEEEETEKEPKTSQAKKQEKQMQPKKSEKNEKNEGEPEYVWLDLNTRSQRTIESLQELPTPLVAWHVPDGNFHGTLENPVQAVRRQNKEGAWVKVVACYKQTDHGWIPAKDYWIRLAEKSSEGDAEETPLKPENTAEPHIGSDGTFHKKEGGEQKISPPENKIGKKPQGPKQTIPPKKPTTATSKNSEQPAVRPAEGGDFQKDWSMSPYHLELTAIDKLAIQGIAEKDQGKRQKIANNAKQKCEAIAVDLKRQLRGSEAENIPPISGKETPERTLQHLVQLLGKTPQKQWERYLLKTLSPLIEELKKRRQKESESKKQKEANALVNKANADFKEKVLDNAKETGAIQIGHKTTIQSILDSLHPLTKKEIAKMMFNILSNAKTSEGRNLTDGYGVKEWLQKEYIEK